MPVFKYDIHFVNIYLFFSVFINRKGTTGSGLTGTEKFLFLNNHEGIMRIEGKETELLESLKQIGFKAPVAKTLIFFLKSGGKVVKSMDIERGAQLRQPEVSMGVLFLLRKKWINRTYEEREGKGRRLHLYTLSVPPEEILKELKEMIHIKMVDMYKTEKFIEQIISS